MADRFINKNYLIDIASQNVIALSDNEKSAAEIRLYKIDKLVYDKKENVYDKLISVYNALQNMDSTALLVISGNRRKVNLYIEVRSESNAEIASKIQTSQ